MRSKYFSATTPIQKECFGQAQESHQRETINRTASRLASSTWRQRRRSCGVFKSRITIAHCPLYNNKWRDLHNYDISVIKEFGMAVDWIAHFMMVLFKRGFPRVLITWRTVPVWISNVKSLIPTDLKAVKRVVWNIMRMHLIMYSVRLLCTTAV